MINIFSNSLGAVELDAVRQVFDSKWLGRGKECDGFEKELAGHFGVEKIHLFNCCTSALYAAVRALKIGHNHEVIIPTISFPACVSAVLEAGGVPVFADVDPVTLNVLPSEIKRLKNYRTKAVFVLHYGGHPADIDAIKSACDGIPIIEDSACSVASTYHGRACGTLGDFGAWSFDAMKTLVTGDGGALYCKPEYEGDVKKIRYLGLDESGSTGMDRASAGESRWWEFKLARASGRFIMNDIAAAIGRVQLKKVNWFIEVRKAVWKAYQTGLAGVDEITLPPEPLPNTKSSYYLFWIKAKRRDELAVFLKERGIYTTFRYYPLHMACNTGVGLPNAEEISDTMLNLPLHQNLSTNDIGLIISSIKEFYCGHA